MKPLIKIHPPGPKAKNILERDSKIISKSTAREYSLVVERASGSNVWDVDGNRYLDFNSFVAVMNFGPSNPKVVEALKNQVQKATHVAFLDFYADLPVKFSEQLIGLMPHKDLNTIHLSNSGTESIEAAMKLARRYTKRPYFISFYGGFHGRTYGSLSLTSSKNIQRSHFGPFLSVIHAPYPNPYRCPVGSNPDKCDIDTISYIENQIFKTEVSPDEVAAIFVEPIQGENGYIVPPISFMRHLRKLCDEHCILLVDDEVQAGGFRTGKFLAIEHFGVKPDIVCMAKSIGGGLPLGATISSNKIMNWPPGSHSSTFGGNLASCTSGLATLELMKDKNLGRSVQKKGEYILKFLNELREKYEIVGDARGLGLMLAIELVKDKKSKIPAVEERNKILRKTFESGLLLLPAGESVIRLSPPLNIEQEDIDTGLEILEKVIKTF